MKSRILMMSVFLSIFANLAFGQNMTVKDSDTNVLMQVEDKGTTGALSVSAVSTDSVQINSMGAAPGKTANKLYNVGGSLYWNGSALGMSGSAGGWTDSGANVYTTTSTDNVGIGTSSPAAKLDIRGTLNIGVNDTGHDVNFYGADTGSRMFWDESKMAFRAGRATGTEWGDANVGDYSIAIGYNSTASGDYSTATGNVTTASGFASIAMGNYTTASGYYTTAMGTNSTASGNYSTAMSYHTTASGNFSTAIGYYTRAQSYASIAMGRWNIGGGNASSWVDTDPLFEIGIGTGSPTRANAMTVLKNGNVGINNTSPGEKLEVSGKIKTSQLQVIDSPTAGYVLTSDASGNATWQEAAAEAGWTDGGTNVYLSTTGDSVGVGTTNPAAKLDIQGTLNVGVDDTGYDVNFYGASAGSRMFWDQSKGAFRAGRAIDTEWDDANVGDYSVAMGPYTTASSLASTAMGYYATAIGRYSIAIGFFTEANGEWSTAMGKGTTADGNSSTAMGAGTEANGECSTAMGAGTEASGGGSTAMGNSTKAESYASTAIGRWNVGGGNATSWVDTDPLFEIGIGTNLQNRANAVTVLKNGNVGINTTDPASKLDIRGTLNVGVDDTGYDINFYGADAGSRMFWDESKMAFRTGRVIGTEWDDVNIGNYSVAMGNNTTASGGASTAMGYYTKAESYATVAIGRFNVGGGNAAISWVYADPLFEIGIGTSPLNRANAMTVLKNGNVGIGDATPVYLLSMESSGGGYYSVSDHTWHNGSSRTLKQDIVPNQMNILEILDQVDIVNYRFKTAVAEDPDAAYHIGFIAEDTPELLSGKDRNSMATGDCIGLLLAIVKEQQEMILSLEQRIQELESRQR